MKQSKKLVVLTLSAAVAAACALPASAAADQDKVRVIVAFQKGKAAEVKNAVGQAKGVVADEIDGMDAMAVEVPANALKGLQNNPHVSYVETDEKRYLFALDAPSGDPYQKGQLTPYGIPLVQADKVSEGSAARKLCIIDSGIDRNHVDLAANKMAGVYDRGTGWWYTDENHHGTHVAGTIAAVNNGSGVVGVNAGAKLNLHIVKVFSADGWAYSSKLSNAAKQCGDAGANVISMSLGGGKPTKTEEKMFDALAAKGVLSVAAAGNDGNTVVSYPAGYASVMMVGALDENKQWASFSQYNPKVEIAAPGVGVLSTVPTDSGTQSALSVGNTTYAPNAMEGSPRKTATAPLADFGTGTAVDATMAGKVCLIQRGAISFAEKVVNCQASGGVAAVVYNGGVAADGTPNTGAFLGTLGTTVTNIPSLTASDTEGAAMKLQLGQAATVAVTPYSYAYYDGTSMATPHVSGVAALVWSHVPNCSASQVRAALTGTALDLGAPGRDDKFGFGLVQAKAALDYLKAQACGK
ncbi:S8 family serine peptidase [Pseudoduganella sp. OTU4001]|uniref:S8 family serine peptidase n=1 Tax=Pseudoduganella sp. OTU4001 TaxID=3043854 RepID=UPI00313E1EC8